VGGKKWRGRSGGEWRGRSGGGGVTLRKLELCTFKPEKKCKAEMKVTQRDGLTAPREVIVVEDTQILPNNKSPSLSSLLSSPTSNA
jgi:hypothetical protein